MIESKQNIFNAAELEAAKRLIDKANWSYGWPSNKDVPYGHWNTDFTHTTKHNPTDVSVRLPIQLVPIWDALNKTFYNQQAKLVRCYANRHTHGTEGYIHTDSDRSEDQTCVINMDPIWNPNWGGETVLYSMDLQDIVKSVIPAYGRVTVFAGNIPHCAKPVSRICPTVRTTLMFKVAINPKAIYPAEEMLVTFLNRIGATKHNHKKGTLADHLVRTYHSLKNAGAGDILAIAGGLHSVYGTNAYKKACLSKESTQVRDEFGPEVDRIVRLYSTVNRPDKLENPDGTLEEVDLFLLRSIECANLYDQNELNPEKYPNLHKFVVQYTN